MATKSLNNRFAVLDSVGDDEVKPQQTLKKPAAKLQSKPVVQEPPKPKGPVVGSELKEAPKQPKQPKQPKPVEEKAVSKDTPKEEQFQKVPEKKKNADHDGQKPKKERFKQRHGEGDKGGVFTTGPNRVFERKSGTGRGHENKKGGAGKGNWGTHKDQISDTLLSKETHEHVEVTSKVSIVEGPTEQVVTATPPATATPATATPATATPATTNTTPSADAVTTPAVTTAPPPAEEEDKSISYAEWLKKSEKAIDVPLPRALRVAGEGIDDTSGWAKIEVQRTEDLVVPAKKEDKKEKKPTQDKKEEKKENKKPTTAAVPLDKVFNLTVKVEEKEERNFKKGPRGDKGDKPKGRGRGKRAGVGVSSPNRIQNTSNKKPEEFNLANDAFPSLSPTQAKHGEVTTTPQTTTQVTTQQQQTTATTNPST